MNKTARAQLGQRVLENTIKVITALPDDEKMVLGTQVLTKQQIIKKFWADEKFAFQLAEQLDKSVKEFLFRKQYKKARRKRRRNKPHGS